MIGSAFYLMAFVDGRIFWNPALPELEREDRRPIYDAMNEGLAKLHAIDVAAAGLSDYGKPGSYFARQFQRWTEQYRASETATIDDMERLIAWLARQGPGRRRPGRAGARRLAHRQHDLRPQARRVCSRCSTGSCRRSAIPSPTSPTNACNGACRPAGIAASAASTARRSGIPTEAEYVAAYCRRVGLEGVPDWTFLIAFSFFRYAAIAQGVYKRSLDGNASNPERARQFGESVPMMARFAMEAVEGES